MHQNPAARRGRVEAVLMQVVPGLAGDQVAYRGHPHRVVGVGPGGEGGARVKEQAGGDECDPGERDGQRDVTGGRKRGCGRAHAATLVAAPG